MDVEARATEGPLAGVTVGGLEVAAAVEVGGVPDTAAQVGQEGQGGVDPAKKGKILHFFVDSEAASV